MNYRLICNALLLITGLSSSSFAADTRTAEQVATDQANAQIAQANAQIQQIKVDEEKVAAAKAAAPQSGLTNSATAGTGAGAAEANYLAAQIVNAMAVEIYTAASGHLDKTKPVVLFTGISAPDLTDAAIFETRRQVVFDEMNQAVKAYGPRSAKFLPAVAALIPSVLSFLNSADSVNGVTITPSNESLEVALAGLLAKNAYHVKIASTGLNQAAIVDLNQKLNELAALRLTVEQDIADAGSVVKLTGDAKIKADNLATAAADYDQFKLDLIGGKGADGKALAPTLSLSNIAKQYSAVFQVKDGKAVFVSVQSTAGGIFTRKNFLTFFGVNPFSVSASAVAYYAVLDGKSDETVAAGLLQQITPYRSIKLTMTPSGTK